jgi:hypothetical protein
MPVPAVSVIEARLSSRVVDYLSHVSPLAHCSLIEARPLAPSEADLRQRSMVILPRQRTLGKAQIYAEVVGGVRSNSFKPLWASDPGDLVQLLVLQRAQSVG